MQSKYGAVPADSQFVENKAKLARYQKWVFFVTFIAYANCHFTRKSYTQVKSQLKSEAGMTTDFLGALDTMFMFAYALGSFLMGNLGDRLRPAAVVGVGLWGAGICVLLFSQGAIIEYPKNYPIQALVAYQVLWLFHGVFQSTGGPVGTAMMGAWFPAKNRGTVFGFWTCHQYIGNITSALVAAYILNSSLDYWWNMVIAATCAIVWGCVLYFMTPSRPEEVGLTLDSHAPTPVPEESGDDQPPPISILEALQIPGVLNYAIAFGFFKLVNYVIFFWLPFLLNSLFTPEQSNMISSLYDIGMMPGGIIVGFVSDVFGGRRALVCSLCFLFLLPLLYVFSNYASVMPVALLLVVLGFMGICIGGPNNIITSAVAADLASHPSILGNNRALGTVTGIINGSGSIIAALGLLFISPIMKAYGTSAVWTLLMACVFIGVGLLSPKIWKEIVEAPAAAEVTKPKKMISVDSFNAFKMISEEGVKRSQKPRPGV